MGLPLDIGNLFCAYLLVVMGVGLLSVLSMHLIAILVVLSVRDTMKFEMLLGNWLLFCGPSLKESVVSDGIFEPLVSDLCMRGVWRPQTEALFDIRVVDRCSVIMWSHPHHCAV